MKERNKILSIRCGAAAIVLTVWWLASIWSSNARFVVSTPGAVLVELKNLFLGKAIYLDMAVTVSEACSGILIGTFVGSITGIILWFFRTTGKAFKPLIVVGANIPVLAFAPLFILWFGIGFSMKVALAVFVTFFVSVSQAYQGAIATDRTYVSTLLGFNAQRRQILFLAIIPASFDSVLNSFRINVGMGLLGAFIGEFVASESGLGHFVLRAASLYQAERVVAGAVCIVGIALLLDYAAGQVSKRKDVLIQAITVPGMFRKARSG